MARFSTREQKEYRKMRVSALLLRGLTRREIVDSLDKQEFWNPRTMKPYALSTIQDDIKELEAEWMEESQQMTEMRLGRVSAENREVRRAAWSTGDYNAVLRSLQLEMKMYGLEDVEITIKHRGAEDVMGDMFGGNALLAALTDMDPDTLSRVTSNLRIAQESRVKA